MITMTRPHTTEDEVAAAHATVAPITEAIAAAASGTAAETGLAFDDAVQLVTNALLHTLATEHTDRYAAYSRALRVLDAAGVNR
jgi:hypothetical protein